MERHVPKHSHDHERFYYQVTTVKKFGDAGVYARGKSMRERHHLHSGGLSRDLAMSTLFTMFVLMPLPRPSI